MLRNEALAGINGLTNFRDSSFSLKEKTEDGKAMRTSQRAEESRSLGNGLVHGVQNWRALPSFAYSNCLRARLHDGHSFCPGMK
jgi:hypothetical protein